MTPDVFLDGLNALLNTAQTLGLAYIAVLAARVERSSAQQ